MRFLLAAAILLFPLLCGARNFQRRPQETSDQFVKRIYGVTELPHPLVEIAEWDSTRKVIVCFLSFDDGNESGYTGYLLTPQQGGAYSETLIDSFYNEGGAAPLEITAVLLANADKDVPRELVVMTKAEARTPRYADQDLAGFFYENHIYDNYDLAHPPARLVSFKPLGEQLSGFDGTVSNPRNGKLIRKEHTAYKDARSIRARLKQLGY